MTYLKWVGNKRKLLHLLRPLFPKQFGDYYEPFLGSGAVFFYIAMDDEDLEVDRSYWLSDKNAWLMNCHHSVAYHPRPLRRRLNELILDDGEKLFKKLRLTTGVPVDENRTGVEEAATFIYLNRRCYGGMWRTNKKGIFNVPFDSGQKSSLLSSSYSRCSKLLRKAVMRVREYYEIYPKEGDFVFLDPPYYPLSGTSNFTGYTPDDWTEEDHKGLMKFLRELDDKGVHFLMTNNDCDFIRSHCDGFRQKSAKVKRYIDAMTHHSKKGSFTKKTREPVNECFVWNYDERG
jgi:DNA adenine methylase